MTFRSRKKPTVQAVREIDHPLIARVVLVNTPEDKTHLRAIFHDGACHTKSVPLVDRGMRWQVLSAFMDDMLDMFSEKAEIA